MYPGGTTFEGPFEDGQKSGTGGKYVCGTTGISFAGEWKDGRIASPPSKLAVEVDTAAASKEETAGQGNKAAKAGAKGGKKAGKGVAKPGKPPVKGAQQQADGEDDRDGRIVAKFDGSDGTLQGLLWCRCVRHAEAKEVSVQRRHRTRTGVSTITLPLVPDGHPLSELRISL